MGKKSGRNRTEKDTRKLIEALSEVIKKKGNRYKFKKIGKKNIDKLKRTCCHWIIRGKKRHPTASSIGNGFRQCKVCGSTFREELLTADQYKEACDQFSSIVNQVFFYSVALGGNSDDTKTFLRLKEAIPKFRKIAPNITKHFRKIQDREKDMMKRSSGFSEFGGSGIDVSYG